MKADNNIFQAIAHIAEIANKSRLGIDSKLHKTLKVIVSCLNTKTGSIMMMRGRKYLEVVASTNPSIVGIKQLIDQESYSAWVVRNKTPLCRDDPDLQNFFSNNSERYKKESFLIAPILNNNKVIGVISITEKIGVDKFLTKEKECLLAIAGIVISTIENNRLSESLKKKKKTIREKNVLLNKHEKLKTEMFQILINDVKGSLTTVMENIEILSSGVTRKYRDNLARVRSGCDALNRITSGLLDISTTIA